MENKLLTRFQEFIAMMPDTSFTFRDMRLVHGYSSSQQLYKIALYLEEQKLLTSTKPNRTMHFELTERGKLFRDEYLKLKELVGDGN